VQAEAESTPAPTAVEEPDAAPPSPQLLADEGEVPAETSTHEPPVASDASAEERS
jgi:hypothetical protein